VLLVPYTLVAIFPAIAGIIGGRYLGKFANACLIIVIFYVGSVAFAYVGSGEFRPVLFLQGIFVSAGFLVPPLMFAVVAILAGYRRRDAAREEGA
jgi:hypothetical protein